MIRFFCIIAALVLADQASKLWILEHFALYESRPVLPGFFNLTHIYNAGAAFGILSDLPLLQRQLFFISTNLIALTILLVMQHRLGRQNFWYTLSFACIAGGALGNLMDRIRWGKVLDFLDFHLGSYHWPAFNVADMSIVTGVFLFLILQIQEDRAEKRAKKDTQEESV
jgi:signal peptidase II